MCVWVLARVRVRVRVLVGWYGSQCWRNVCAMHLYGELTLFRTKMGIGVTFKEELPSRVK